MEGVTVSPFRLSHSLHGLVAGRAWKAAELRLKSWDDLHKLWYVFLKEKNMLFSQKQMLLSQSLRMPNPERMAKVTFFRRHLEHFGNQISVYYRGQEHVLFLDSKQN